MDLQAIMAAVATAVRTTGLRAFDHPPGQMPVPGAVVELAQQFLTYNTSTGSHDVRLQVRLFVSEASDRAGASALNAYLAPTGTSSVKAAIEGNAALDALIDWATVTSARAFGAYEVGGQQLLGATVDVTLGVQ